MADKDADRLASYRLVLDSQLRGLTLLDSLRGEMRARSLTIISLATAITGLIPASRADQLDQGYACWAIFFYVVTVLVGAYIAAPQKSWEAIIDLDTVSGIVSDREEGVSMQDETFAALTAMYDDAAICNDKVLRCIGKAQWVLLVALVICTALWAIAILETGH